jgi:hypothetical protein
MGREREDHALLERELGAPEELFDLFGLQIADGLLDPIAVAWEVDVPARSRLRFARLFTRGRARATLCSRTAPR